MAIIGLTNYGKGLADLSEERSGGRRFNSASDGEILGAEVADSYFHRTMEILRARGLEDTPVHAEVAYKTSDPDEWFVVAGLDEVATSSRRRASRPTRCRRARSADPTSRS